jgi:signal transduction histidine kinase/HAMP domain-containing protein
MAHLFVVGRQTWHVEDSPHAVTPNATATHAAGYGVGFMRRTRGLSTRLVVAIGVLVVLHVGVFVVLLVTLHALSDADRRAHEASRVVVAANDARVALARGDAVALHAAGDALLGAARDAGAPGAAATGAAVMASSTRPAGRAAEAALDRQLDDVVVAQRAIRNADREQVRELTRYAWIAGVSGVVATLLCAVCFLAYVRRAMLAPLRGVADAARQLAAGDLHARVGSGSGVGEVGELARTFDQMAGSLEESRTALERQNRELAQQRSELIEAVRSAREGASIVRATVDATPDAIALLDGDGGVIVDNPPMRAVRAAFAAHASALDPAARGDHNGGAERRDEIVLPGTRRTFARFAAPVHDGRGRAIGRLLVLRDVTGEREAERAKEDFFALVSHELRTPLTAILGYVELVLSDDTPALPQEHGRHLEVVERNARRLVRLVGDLLFAAQVEGAPLLIEPGSVDLVQLVRDAVDLSRPRAEEGGVVLELELTPLEPCLGDRDRLAQVLDNLVSNALKFTPPGGRVAVRLSADGGRARIEVADTGVGIPAGDLPHLFDRFYRARNVAERAIPGLGLGLMIVRAIAEAHGGAVMVRSEVGRGTTFTVLLPLRAPDGDEPRPLHSGAAGAPEGAEPPPAGGGR